MTKIYTATYQKFKALTESQLELLQTKIRQIQNVLDQASALQKNNTVRVERMKTELGIPQAEAKEWQMSKDGKGFEREKQVKKTTVKDRKGKK